MQLGELESGSRIIRGGYEYIVTNTYQSHQGKEHRRLINLRSGSPLILPVDVTVVLDGDLVLTKTPESDESESESKQNNEQKA